MKTMLLFAALMWVSATNKIFANEVKITPAAMQSFKSAFSNATDVQWSVVDRMYKAVFTLDEEPTIAFFNIDDGSLVASCHYMAVSDLPCTLQRSLKAATGSATIIEVFDVQNDNGTDYFATVQKGDEKIILKAAASKWNVYKKD